MNMPKMIDSLGSSEKVSIRSRKVVLWGWDGLLAQSIGLFLEADMNWDVIRILDGTGIDKLMEETKRIIPEVVILCQERVDVESVLPMRLISEHLCQKVVAVSLESNLMQVYSKHEVMLQGASDLLSIIESGDFSNCISVTEVNQKK